MQEKAATMSILEDCARLLGSEDDREAYFADVKRRCLDKLAVLERVAHAACTMASDDDRDGDPARTYQLVCMVSCLVDGIDNVHRHLKHAEPDSEAAVKPLAEVRKGAFKNLLLDVTAAIDYDRPVNVAVMPAMRTVVKVMKDLRDLSAA